MSGTIGERFGRAQATRIAFVVYALASLGAAAAGSLVPFVAARALQGSANAFTSPLVLAGLADTTPREQLGRTMGTFAAVQTAGMVRAADRRSGRRDRLPARVPGGGRVALAARRAAGARRGGGRGATCRGCAAR